MSRLLPAAPGVPAPDHTGQEPPGRRPVTLAGIGRSGPHSRPDPLEAVGAWLHLVCGRVQGMAQELAEVLSLRWHPVGAGSGHDSCPKAARSAVMPRAVWLLTAPRLIPMAAAISASDKSA